MASSLASASSATHVLAINNVDWFEAPLSLLLPHLYDRLPLDLCREIRHMLWQPLTDSTIHEAARQWCDKYIQREACERFGLIEHWDVSQVTNMNNLFFRQSNFNEDISQWNVGQVTDMGSMFEGAKRFNQQLSTWDVGQVTTMMGMFKEASSFNQPLSTWDVSQVTDLSGMFYGASSFNQPLADWEK